MNLIWIIIFFGMIRTIIQKPEDRATKPIGFIIQFFFVDYVIAAWQHILRK